MDIKFLLSPKAQVKSNVLYLICILAAFCFVVKHQDWSKLKYEPPTSQKKATTTSTFKAPDSSHISKDHWPQTSFEGWLPLPIKESVIDHHEELSFFMAWTQVMEEGINNRYNMVTVLNSRRDKNDYWEMFSIFEAKQKKFISNLQKLDVPERLRNFHTQVVDASLYQINLYAKWTEKKAVNPSAKLDEFLNDVNLKRCNELLWAAYYEFQRLYPNRDKPTNDAIEMRLCQFDVI